MGLEFSKVGFIRVRTNVSSPLFRVSGRSAEILFGQAPEDRQAFDQVRGLWQADFFEVRRLGLDQDPAVGPLLPAFRAEEASSQGSMVVAVLDERLGTRGRGLENEVQPGFDLPS